MKILVTGASGFIGSKLVAKLVAQGHTVRTLGRSTLRPCLASLSAEHIVADIMDFDKVAAAVTGSEAVYHLAGLVSYQKAVRDRQYRINVAGTRNVLDSCLKSGVQRVIHTSSVAAMGIPPDGQVGDESFVYNLSGRGLNYCDTKHEGELVVREYQQRGLPVIMLCPGIVLGEGDTHPHHKAIFMALSKGWLMGWPAGGVSFCDIEDVVDAHLNALTMGQVGQRYVLSSANLTYREATVIVSRVLGAPEPRFEIPGALVELAGQISELVLPLLGRRPALTRQVAWLSQQKIFFSAGKAIAELAYQQTDFEQLIRRVAPYYLGAKPASGVDAALNLKT
jgi:dihydroflavonol-4-reductase